MRLIFDRVFHSLPSCFTFLFSKVLARTLKLSTIEEIMRLLLAGIFLCNSVGAFVPHTSARQPSSVDGITTSSALLLSASPPEDFMKRSQQVKTVLEDDEKPPKLFEDDLLEDMQQSLLLLDRRVKEGPGALTMDEVDEFEAATQRILKEMKEFNASGGSMGSAPGVSSV